MSQPYLILHKVRGEPAYDIAERIEIGDEEGWIIPTSGHRAYPYQYFPLTQVFTCIEPYIAASDEMELNDMPLNWPDHYSTNSTPPTILRTTASALLAKLGLGAKPIGRRKV